MSVDVGTLLASVGTSLVGGGIVGGVVSLVVSKRESRDRGAALAHQKEESERRHALEREKWEHERDASLRERQRAAMQSAVTALGDLQQQFANSHYKVDADLSKPVLALMTAVHDLDVNGLTEAAEKCRAVVDECLNLNYIDHLDVNERAHLRSAWTSMCHDTAFEFERRIATMP